MLVDCQLGMKYKEIIDNKRTDSVSVKEKDEAWHQLASEFSAANVSLASRDWKQLKHVGLFDG